MDVTKEQIIKGVIQFAKADVIAKVPDKPFRMGLSAAVYLLELKPKIADIVLEHPVARMISNENGTYDLELLCEVAEKTIKEYGDFSITIKGNSLAPEKRELKFVVEDVEKIKAHIERA